MLIPFFRGTALKHMTNMEQILPKNFSRIYDSRCRLFSKPYEEWTARLPETYQNPSYPNIFAPGIAFAPPHSISKPRKSPNGTEFFQRHQEQECHLELLPNWLQKIS